MSFYTGAVKVLSGLFKLVYNLEIHDAENVPVDGKYLVVCNHISLGDVIILAISCKRQIHFMAKKELFSIPVLGSLIKSLGAFPVDRKGSAFSALKTAIGHLENEKLVGIFPQGTRKRNVSVEDTEFKSGAAMCAIRAQAGIIPVYIQTKNQRFKLFSKSHVYFGTPTSFESLPYDEEGSDKYKPTTDVIKDKIFELEKKAYGGKYNAKN
jgi:1-acyl-sn-glycerol-3-phosphate acyltransferase